jgi:hypothetical protein
MDSQCRLKLVETQYDRSLANNIIINHHSYVPTVDTVGRHIDYLIYWDKILCGMIGIGSATYPPCKDVLHYTNLSKSQYKQAFNSFANNWKFCLCRHDIKNLGTMSLKQLRSRCQEDWFTKYGDHLEYLITFVGSNKTGSVYLADNWKLIGETSGLPPHKSVSMKWDLADLENKFITPTGEDKKLIFIYTLPQFNSKSKLNKLF